MLAVSVVAVASRGEPGRAGAAAETSAPALSPSSLPISFDAPEERSSEAIRAAGSTDAPLTTTAAESVPGRLVVKFEDGTAPATARRVLAEADAQLETTVSPLDLHVVEVPPGATEDAIEEIAAAAPVEYVERDTFVEGFATVPNDTLWPEQWGPVRIGAPAAWDAEKGSPRAIIAVLDTGIDGTHPDLEGALVPGYDFVNGDASPTDDNGHGTAVAGVIAARTDNGEGQAGMCWRCSLMPIKVLDANRSGTTSAVAAGVVWAVDHGAQVISMSLGGTEPTRSLGEAVAYGVARGVVLVAAAGNEGSLDMAYPAGYIGVIGVAASTPGDGLYEWSNYGPSVQVAAPGCNMTPAFGREYVNVCGTSAAAPLVAGIAGLALSARPQATRMDIENALFYSATPIGASVRFGRVNADLTLTALGVKPAPPAPATPQAPPPAAPAPAAAPAPTPAPTPTAIPDRPVPAPDSPGSSAPRGTNATTGPTTSDGRVTTIQGTASARVRLAARGFRAGRLTATLTAPGARALTLELVDGRGVRVARSSGRSPLRLSRLVKAGRYGFLVRSDARVPFTIRVRSGGA